MANLKILPQTDGVLEIELDDADGNPISTGVVTMNVYSPKGSAVATGASFNHFSGNIWRADIDADWSEQGGKAVEGEYMAEITAVNAGVELVQRLRYIVRFEDLE